MGTKRKSKKPPRCVLLDTRAMGDLGDLTAGLHQGLARLAEALDRIKGLEDRCRELTAIVSLEHAARQTRSERARRAAATRAAGPAQQAEADILDAVNGEGVSS